MEGLVRLDFSDLARVKARLQAIVDLGIAEEQFTATGADLVLRVPEAEVEAVSRLISDLTSGRSELIID